MAKDWQKMLDTLSGSNHSSTPYNASPSSNTSVSKPSSSSKSSSSTSRSGSSSSGSNDWQGILSEISGSRKSDSDNKSGGTGSRVESRVITRATKKDEEEEEKKKKRKWYEKGHFEDGWDFGDITKTILGIDEDTASLKDLTVGSVKRGYLNSIYGEESFKAMNGGKNKKDEYAQILAGDEYQFTPGNDAAGAVSGAMELLGQQFRQFTNPSTLALAGTAATMAGIAGQAGPQVLAPEEVITVPAAAMAGFTAGSAKSNLEIEAGHAYNEMLEAGISEETAKKVATAVGAVNASLEILQVDELLDAYKVTKASGATKTFTKKILDELVDRGVDVAKETVQEVAQEGVTIAGTQYASQKDKGEYAYNSDDVKDRLKDTAKSSALSFGLMNAPAAVKNTVSIASEQHKANSLTKNEQAVVDKVVADRVAEAEKDGKKLSNSEKRKINESVVAEMEKGYIPVDTIEEVLGGEKYSQYKQTAEWEDSLQTEFDTLNKMKQGDMTGEQVDRREALREQLKNVKATSSQSQQRTQIRDEVMGLVKGDRLAESYNERARTGQKFEADVTKYDAKQQAVVQKAIDSGILNNSNRTHEFVDFVSKISADTGVLFDFSNTAKIREAGFAVEGQTVDGFITKDGITVNIDSPKSRQFVVGHEITHALEGTDLYDALRQSVFDYAKMKNQYGVRMESIQKRYKEGTDYEAELTADLVGEYIFSDTDFINNLSTQNRNVFQKVYDEIKYLCKVATAGSKEARELEKVKRAFENAYKEAGNVQGDMKYSLTSEAKSNPNVSKVDSYSDYGAEKSVFRDGWLNSNPKMLEAIVENRKQTETKEFASWFGNSKATNKSAEPLLVYHGTKSRFTEFNSDGKPIWFSPNVMYSRGGATQTSTGDKFLPSGKVFGGANERVIPAYIKAENPADFGNTSLLFEDVVTDISQNLGIDEAALRNVWEQTGRNAELYKTIHSAEMVELLKQHGYDSITAIEDGSPTWAVFESNQAKSAVANKGSFNISDPDIRYSLSDSDGKQLTKEQQEYFKDSKMRDENGNLKVMYHGSQDAGFHVFDSSMSDDGTSLFFVDRNDVAASYSGTSETYEAKTIRTAEDMNNFLAEIGYDQYEAVEKDGKFELLEDGDYVATSDTAQGIYEEFCWYEGVGEGDANYKVYLNLKNPLEVDAGGKNWNNLTGWSKAAYLKPENVTVKRVDDEFRLYDENNAEVGNTSIPVNSYTENMDNDTLRAILIDKANNILSIKTEGMNTTRDVSKFARQNGYDGVIFKNIHDNGGYSNGDEGASTVAIAFDSNQIKSVANAKPTADPDIRYSLSDSNGRELSEEQSEYFKDSKVRDESGRLLPVYHGSKNSGFNTFQYSKDVQSGTDYGEAYYFTSDRQKARGYSYDATKDERIAKYQAEREALKNRFLETRSKEDADAFLNYRYEGKKLADLIDDESYNTDGGEVKEVYLNLTNPLIADAGGKYYYEVYPEYFEEARKNDNDGIIVKNVIDNPRGEARPIDTYIAFRPEQIKNVDNVKPTPDPDIRYSLTEYTPEEKKEHNKAVLGYFGKTYKWAETGYVLLDGSRLDLSGKHEGAPGGYRSVDHRDIVDALGSDYGDGSYSGSLVQFMSEGNIRISPECAGINLSVKPNRAQELSLSDFISRNRGKVLLDIDGSDGYTVVSVEYPRGTHANKVLNDIRGWFDNGTKPEVSITSQFRSLSNVGEQHTRDSLSALRLQTAEESTDVAPVSELVTEKTPTVAKKETVAEAPVTADDMSAVFPNDAVPVQEELEQLLTERNQLFSALEIAVDRGSASEVGKLAEEYEAINARIKALESTEAERTGSITDADVPAEMKAPYQPSDEDYEGVQETVDDPFEQRDIGEVGKQSVKAYQYENPEVKPFFQEAALGMLYDVRNTTKGEKWYNDELYYATGGEQGFGGTKRRTTDDIAELKDVYGYTYDQIEMGLNAIIEDDGAENNAVSKRIEFMLNDRLLNGYRDIDGRPYEPNQGYIKLLNEKQITEYSKEAFDQFMANADQYAPSLEESYAPILNSDPRYEQTAPTYDLPGGQQTYVPTKATYDATPTDDIAPLYDATGKKGVPDGQQAFMPDAGVEKKQTRKEYHQSIIDNIKSIFRGEGFDFDKVLKDAKNLSTWSTVDNTPQRVMEKALGYKEGGILADITVNKVAQNETEGIKWLNAYVDQLKQISKQYGIKPGSKESAAAQMYAEGFFVNENNEIIRYGDPELIQDFGNADVRRRIKGLARDPRIRKIYDDTLANINASRARNLYPEIPRLDNYFLHFRAMEDTFSTLGLPFNPNDIRAKDLPTDLNGVTADLKPGQPYFASANHRTGKRTSFDLLGGVERYLNSAKNQIYHIDDIQTLRALRNYIADSYGQAKGLENLDELSQDAQWEQIKKVYNSHLSTFAKFLNEEANVLAGKTALVDRGIEGLFGRRAMTFLNTLKSQVGSNMVGGNVSSSLTNFMPVAQTFAKANKFDFTKAFVQTVANKFSGGRLDTFAEDSPVVIRRKGADRFAKTMWQKMADPGYALMGMVDDISTEIIARTKYNELTRKGMDSQKAHFETDKWVSKLMGDRSLGQQPQLYNSKMFGLLTQFQLEVRNQLDMEFYDTYQEAKASSEQIENALLRNAKTAAKTASTIAQLTIAQHLYGKAFEAIAGYNPAFDIIEVLATLFGYDDEEDSEDTVLDNLSQALLALAEDMPYASTFTGGRIPISAAIPDVNAVLRGEDQYGNEIGIPKALWNEAKDIAPYYIMPTGYGQLKKTTQGLKMFSDDHPIAGSYTDAGNLRYDVEDTVGSRIKAGIFGQYASENAQKYFDQEQRTLNPEQTEIFAGLNIPIEEYWEYRDNLYEFYDVKDQLQAAAKVDGATAEDILKSKYISAVYSDISKLYNQQKEVAKGNSLLKKSQLRDLQNQMSNMLTDSKRMVNNVNIDGYYATIGDKRFDYSDYNGAWFEIEGEYLEKEQNAIKRYDITPSEYWNNTDLYYWADRYFDDKYADNDRELIAKTVFGGKRFAPYAAELSQIKGEDKNGDGKTDSGSKKDKVIEYINGLDLDYGERIIMYRTMYSSKSDKRTYNQQIIDYLNERDDISYQEMKTILEELDMEVDSKGYITW